MATSRQQKEKMLGEYADNLSRSKVMILANYRGLTVAQLTDLRQRLREQNSNFQVIKNTLFARVLKDAAIPVTEDQLDGPLGVSFCFGDAPPVAKVLLDFARETQILQVQGAILGARLVPAEKVRELADLPPREVILAQLLGTVQGPMSSLVSTINAPLREIVQVLTARAEQGQEEAA